MSTTRIYVVTQKSTPEKPVCRLIEATSVAQAIRHCVQNVYTAKAATPKDVATYLGTGLCVEHATTESVTTGTTSATT